MKYGELKRKNEEEILKLQEYDCGEGGMLPLLHFPLLDETGIVKNAFTTREGGVSKGIFESLNLSITRGDDPDAVNAGADPAELRVNGDLCLRLGHAVDVQFKDAARHTLSPPPFCLFAHKGRYTPAGRPGAGRA